MTDREAIQGALEALDRYEHEPSHVGRERAVVEARDLLQAAIASQSAELAALRADAELLAWILAHPETCSEVLQEAADGEGHPRELLERRRIKLAAAMAAHKEPT